MDFLFVLLSILIITLLIVVHEFGHFLAAKFYGFQTPIFGIGMPFGPYIEICKKWGTSFRFYFLFIGGFVALPETHDETSEETLRELDLKPFRQFPVLPRAVVAVAGVAFNVIFAFLLAVIMAVSIGLPKIVPSTVIKGFTSETSAAKIAGLEAGDKILSINGIAINTGIEMQNKIAEFKDQDIQIKVANKDKVYSVHSEGVIGVQLGYEKEYIKSENIFSAIFSGLKFTVNATVMMIFSVFAILASLLAKVVSVFGLHLDFATASLGDVKGIVGIVQFITQDIKHNLWMILEFAFLLSLNLAVINLLPIPALDGGHLLFLGYEAIFKKKPSTKLQDGLVQAGFIFLLSLMAITTINDIRSFFVK
jgi:membrane-associated protease RseP (regulator of RpoE activity)